MVPPSGRKVRLAPSSGKGVGSRGTWEPELGSSDLIPPPPEWVTKHGRLGIEELNFGIWWWVLHLTRRFVLKNLGSES